MSSYIGCYLDQGDGITRDLPYSPLSDYGELTIELCISQCSDNGYKYAAVQFGYYEK